MKKEQVHTAEKTAWGMDCAEVWTEITSRTGGGAGAAGEKARGEYAAVHVKSCKMKCLIVYESFNPLSLLQ